MKHISVDGINTEEGLARVLNNTELYHELLSRFYNSYHDIFTHIQENDQKLAFEENRIIVHTIKGSGGNLGADELYTAAEALENAYRENRTGDIALPPFKAALERASNGIHAYLLSKTNELPEETLPRRKVGDMVDAFTELYNQLKEFTMDAQSSAKQILGKLDSPEQSAFKPIAEKISDLQYEEAEQALITFLQPYGIILGGK